MKEVFRHSAVKGIIEAPSSKSYAQRAIVAALLCEGSSVLHKMVLCDDTRWAMRVAEVLGAKIERIDVATYRVAGGVKYGADGAPIFEPKATRFSVGESGLSARMFAPVAALCGREITIDGEGTLMERPMGLVVDPLIQLGAEVSSREGRLPLSVKGPLKGGEVNVNGSVSSQFLTGLLIALPLAEEGTTIYVSELNSKPYIDMTIETLREFGVEVDHNDYLEFYVRGRQRYTPQEYAIEGDWSAAAAMLVAGAVAGEVVVKNLNPLSKQADVAIMRALTRAGAGLYTTPDSVGVKRREELRGFEFDATDCPDLFPALVALAANCKGVTTIKGTNRLHHKESDRAEALYAEFLKMGIEVDLSQENYMRIVGGEIGGAVIDSHNDHRVAMSTAVAALNSTSTVTIEGAEAVNKSYPNFWRDLRSIKVK